MAIEKIDTLQSTQIATLKTHLNELKTKLNLMVTDILAITEKLNIVIGDLNDMNNIIMEGYTSPGSPESYGILEALDQYKDEFQDHEDINIGGWETVFGNHRPNLNINTFPFTGNYQGIISHSYIVHSDPAAGSGPPPPPPTYDAPVIDGTGQGTNSSHTAGAEDSIALGDYENKKIILSLGVAQTNRAKKLARQTLNRLRK